MVFWEIVALALFVITVYLFFKNREWEIKFDQKVKEWLEKEEQKIREDAIQRSARILSGKTLEKLVPFLENFNYDPHDVRWLGDPIDLVIFDGHSKGNLNQVVFCEVKSGESKLTSVQNKIKELIEKKKVKWEEFRI
jgi:predicted Holliday junction resolvase-like endonuclease